MKHGWYWMIQSWMTGSNDPLDIYRPMKFHVAHDMPRISPGHPAKAPAHVCTLRGMALEQHQLSNALQGSGGSHQMVHIGKGVLQTLSIVWTKAWRNQ